MKINKYKMGISKIILWAVLAISIPGSMIAQDLEPRFLSPAPVGMNFVILGYGYSDGNVLLDQALPIEDTEAKLHAVTVAYARSIDFFGLSGRIQAALPYATATWHGEVDGIDSSTTRTGIGDAMIALAVNIIGAPALKGKEFMAYERKTVIGIGLKVRIPTGQYNPDKFFNLGSNRWSIGLRLGISQKIRRFVIEGYLNGWYLTTNTNFFGGNTVSQDPLYAAQIHVTYLFPRGIWAALSFGQLYGGAVGLNDEPKKNIQINNRLGAAVSLPLSSTFGLKLAITTGTSTRYGADFDIYVAALQYRWGGI
jgi:hypothetical protein